MAHAAYNDPNYKALRQRILADHPHCAICGRPGADTLDHIQPLELGGTNEEHNLRPAHRSCNSPRGRRRRLQRTLPMTLANPSKALIALVGLICLTVLMATHAISSDAGLPILTTTYRDWETDRKSTRLNSSHRL